MFLKLSWRLAVNVFHITTNEGQTMTPEEWEREKKMIDDWANWLMYGQFNSEKKLKGT